MTVVSNTQFRTDLPEFTDPQAYPDTLLTTWLTVAANQVQNADRWGTLLTLGQELVAAHYVYLAQRDRAAAARGAVPGETVGLKTAKATADVSVSIDYTLTTDDGAGFWNQSSYGQRYFQLARLMGAGGLQISPNCCFC